VDLDLAGPAAVENSSGRKIRSPARHKNAKLPRLTTAKVRYKDDALLIEAPAAVLLAVGVSRGWR